MSSEVAIYLVSRGINERLTELRHARGSLEPVGAGLVDSSKCLLVLGVKIKC